MYKRPVDSHNSLPIHRRIAGIWRHVLDFVVFTFLVYKVSIVPGFGCCQAGSPFF